MMHRLQQHRFLFLLVSQLVLVLSYPLLGGRGLQKYLLTVMFGWILLSTLWATLSKRRWVVSLSLLGGMVVLAQLVGSVTGSPLAGRLSIEGSVLFYLLGTIAILGYVLNNDPVTLDKICAALSAYLFLALLWGVAYQLLYTFQPDAFSIAPALEPTLEEPGFSVFLYCSMVTVTTLGYGDITPVSAMARSLTSVEAMVGQIYLAVLVARLVGLHIAATGQGEEPPSEPGPAASR